MKKTLSSLAGMLLVLSLLPCFLNGQTGKAGFHGGFGLSDFSDNDFYTKHGSSFLIGAFKSFPFTDKLSLQLELNFDKKGDKDINFPLGNPSVFNTPYKFYYLGIPVLLQYSFGEKFKYVPAAGASVHYLLLEKYDEEKQTSEYKKVDAGLVLSQQLQIGLGEAYFLKLEGRSYHGLTVADKPDNMANDVGRHSSFLFLAGLGFILK